jgi:hypothetical protein
MARRRTAGPSVEIFFVETPDGLLRDRIILRNTTAPAEADLRLFLDRLRDHDLDVSLSTGGGATR